MKQRKSKPATSHARIIVSIGAILVVVVIGIAVITNQMISGLDENSKKLRNYDVKPSVKTVAAFDLGDQFTGMGHEAFGERDPHPQATDYLTRGQAFERNHLWSQAAQNYGLAIHAYERDWVQKISTPGDSVAVRALYAKISHCLVMLKNYPPAIAHITCALGQPPDSPAYLRQRADIYDLMNEPKLAQKDRLAAQWLVAHPIKSTAADVVDQMFGTDDPKSAH